MTRLTLCLALFGLAACDQLAGKTRAQDGGGAGANQTAAASGEAGRGWWYFHTVDPMTDVVIRGGCVPASEQLRQSPPYQTTPVELCLREDSKGREVIVRMLKDGQFTYKSYASDPILIRFDRNQPEEFRAMGPLDFGTTEFAIRPSDEFERKMLSAQRVLLQPSVYQGGQQTLTFNVSGYAWPEQPTAAPPPSSPRDGQPSRNFSEQPSPTPDERR